jgi:hypothetical protein
MHKTIYFLPTVVILVVLFLAKAQYINQQNYKQELTLQKADGY